MAETAWLRCEDVKPGMFSDERAVVVHKQNGSTVSFFVSASAVEDSLLKVQLLVRGSYTWAVLPTPDADAIPIRTSDLASRCA